MIERVEFTKKLDLQRAELLLARDRPPEDLVLCSRSLLPFERGFITQLFVAAPRYSPAMPRRSASIWARPRALGGYQTSATQH